MPIFFITDKENPVAQYLDQDLPMMPVSKKTLKPGKYYVTHYIPGLLDSTTIDAE